VKWCIDASQIGPHTYKGSQSKYVDSYIDKYEEIGAGSLVLKDLLENSVDNPLRGIKMAGH
jgi:hypothetical protein